MQSLESLLRTVQSAWCRACEAAELQARATMHHCMLIAEDGTPVPQRLIFQPLPGAAVAPLTMELSELWPRQRLRPASLELSFDCELRQQRDGSWHLHIVDPAARARKNARPRHRIDITMDAHGHGEVRFDAQLLRTFGSIPEEQ